MWQLWQARALKKGPRPSDALWSNDGRRDPELANKGVSPLEGFLLLEGTGWR